VAAIALALSSSLLWGLSDFLGGLKSRTLPMPVVLGGQYLVSLIAMSIFVAARGVGPPATDAVVASLGTMSIVAPIAATGVALPVLVGIATGDRPGLVCSAGLAAAVVGIVFASREDDGGALDPRQQRQSIALAMIAAAGFGSYFVLAEIGANADVPWALALSRVAATPFIIGVVVLALRPGARRPHGWEIGALVAIGLLDLAANATYNVATTIGERSAVAVASSLYPVMTVLMASLVLGERVRGVQRVGVLVALTGVVLIAAGS
jgi:drug/metabolite transporter (DMT)-like permease